MKTILKSIAICLTAIAVLAACQPDDSPKNNGFEVNISDINPNFNIIQEGTSNSYQLIAVDKNIIGSKWNLGDGNPTFLGKMSQKIFLPDAGTYDIEHTAIGKGGTENSTKQTIVVALNDVNSGNLVQGGKFKNAVDHSKWSVLNIAGNTAAWTFGTGFARISGSANQYSQQGIYQAIQVVANKKYDFDMLVSGGGGNSIWFEVYVGTAVPAQGADYNSGGKRFAIDTGKGCGAADFNGLISNVGCDGERKSISFPNSGTVYLVIRSGGFGNYTLGTNGISITNVTFRGAKV